jgi:hypothetical protein
MSYGRKLIFMVILADYFPNNSSGFSLKSVKILELQFYLKQKESKIIFIYSLPRAAADGMCAAWYFACW